MVNRWIGIDNGCSQMTIAILDSRSDIVAMERIREPLGDGHSRDVALARLHCLLRRLDDFRCIPARLAGYCYEDSGVLEAFIAAGWTITGCKVLNDVVGFYGLTDMNGHTIVGGCGSFSQVVYVNTANTVYWPGDDVTARLPRWLLSGWEYASFLLELSKREYAGEFDWLAREVRDILGGETLESPGCRWGNLGPLLDRLYGYEELNQFIAQAADVVLKTRNVFMEHIRTAEPPRVVLGGGAIRNDCLWKALKAELGKQGEDIIRIEGEPAIGLARFASSCPDADAWAYIGHKKPSWL